jgi:hypothetical protein
MLSLHVMAGRGPVRVRLMVRLEKSPPPPLAIGGWGRGTRYEVKLGIYPDRISLRWCDPSPQPPCVALAGAENQRRQLLVASVGFAPPRQHLRQFYTREPRHRSNLYAAAPIFRPAMTRDHSGPSIAPARRAFHADARPCGGPRPIARRPAYRRNRPNRVPPCSRASARSKTRTTYSCSAMTAPT